MNRTLPVPPDIVELASRRRLSRRPKFYRARANSWTLYTERLLPACHLFWRVTVYNNSTYKMVSRWFAFEREATRYFMTLCLTYDVKYEEVGPPCYG